MDKHQLMLAALAPAGQEELTPVQVQKLLFLIDRNIGSELNGTGYKFIPYDYGPFDSSVYEVMRTLESKNLANAALTDRGWKKYCLTSEGLTLGNQYLAALSPRAQDYICRVSEFVRKSSFSDLVSSIYKAYPEMKANSVFQG